MLIRIDETGPEVYNVSVLEKSGFKTFVTGRLGGVSKKPFDSLNTSATVGDNLSDVAENMRRVKNSAGILKLWAPTQVHGDKIFVIDTISGLPETAEADAVVVTTPGIAGAIKTADCAPILLADPVKNIVAAIHAGKRSTELHIASKTVAIMTGLGSQPSDIISVIGPCIRKCCYEVDLAMAQDFHTFCGGDGGRMLDIAGACEVQLKEAGLLPQNLHDSSICTSCDNSMFFSYRRDGGVTGRFMSGIEARSA